MNLLLATLPYIHFGSVLLLAIIFLTRTYFLVTNPRRATTKRLASITSLLILATFFSGITQAYLLKIPFDSDFVLLKIVGLITFTGLGITAFMPRRKKTTALVMIAIGFIAFSYLFYVSYFIVSKLLH